MRGIVAGFVVAISVFLAATDPALAAAAQSSTDIYRVRPGDTLWALAQRFGTSPEHLASLNGMAPDAILQIGQPLKVPRAAVRPGAVAAAAPPAATTRTATTIYRIREGDTLWALARRFGTTPVRLAAMNRIRLDATLQIGQRLTVPSPAGAKALAASGTPATKQEAVTPAMRARLAALPSRGPKWASTIVALSTRYLGVRYRWGGTTPKGFDCSGFLNFVFERTGVELPRTTYVMFESGTPVPRDQLQVGDIVFFQTLQPGPSHAGVYLGDGRFIHSSSGFGRVTITPMDHRYYAPRYLGARRF
ncbi:MAG: LysM peptidoglycan-binding domain-containing protein [Armatimonadetes bacterium]|nr:LysM peptidoglycan-binding domain-containing protein [Armatimonadota bacterium]